MLSLTLLSMMASHSLSKRRRVSSPSSQICMFHLLPDKSSGMYPQLALPCKKSCYSSSFADTWACSWILWSSRLPIVPWPESLGRNHSFQFFLDVNVSKAANRLCSYQGDRFLLSCKLIYLLIPLNTNVFLVSLHQWGVTSFLLPSKFSLCRHSTANLDLMTRKLSSWMDVWLLCQIVLLDRHNDWKRSPVMVAFKK